MDRPRRGRNEFLLLLAGAKGTYYGGGKLSSLISKNSREVAVYALFSNRAYDELYHYIMNMKFPFAQMNRYILAGMASCLIAKEKKRALNLARQLVPKNVPEICRILVLLIEGHIALEENNLFKAKEWIQKGLSELSVKFNFSVFALTYKIFQEVLLESEKVTLSKLFSVAKYKDPKYFESVSDIKDIKRLQRFLELKGIDTGTLEREYIRKNPLTQKAELLKYFERHREDKDTLKYVLERRVCKELEELAKELGIMKGCVEEKQTEKEWMKEFTVPPRSSLPVKKRKKARTAKRKRNPAKIGLPGFDVDETLDDDIDLYDSSEGSEVDLEEMERALQEIERQRIEQIEMLEKKEADQKYPLEDRIKDIIEEDNTTEEDRIIEGDTIDDDLIQGGTIGEDSLQDDIAGGDTIGRRHSRREL